MMMKEQYAEQLAEDFNEEMEIQESKAVKCTVCLIPMITHEIKIHDRRGDDASYDRHECPQCGYKSKDIILPNGKVI